MRNAVLSKGMSAEGSCANKGVRSITSDARNTDVSNAEAAATPPPQLPTQHASKFPSSSLFFFFFKFVREVGVGHHSQEDLAKFGYRSEESKKVLLIVLHFGDMVEPIVNIWRFQKQNLIMWLAFST
jgi:hypothetical protein